MYIYIQYMYIYTYNKTPQYPKEVVRKQTRNGKFIANNN